MQETHIRSSSKSIIWRIVGIFILGIVTYVYTRRWVHTGLITFIHHAVFLLVFYIHERIWLNIKWGSLLQRSIFKMFTYETLCGNIILGIITYAVTGNARQMTAITLTYIGIKHLVYVWNEFIWDKIKWHKAEDF